MELFSYQKAAVDFYKDKKKCILADDMGLGKTAPTIVSAYNPGCKVLIVCPNTAKSVWEDQIKEWVPEAKVVTVNSKDGREVNTMALALPFEFTIVNYEMITTRTCRDEKGRIKCVDSRLTESLRGAKWSTIILDEAHKIKNRKSKAFKAVQGIARESKVENIFLVTGTPMLNRPEELWTLLHLIDPKKYSSYWDWVGQHCAVKMSYAGRPHTEIQGVKDAEKLREELAPYMLRRSKAEVWKDAPEKIFQTIRLDMLPEQTKIYEKMKKEMFAEIAGKEIDAINALVLLGRLKQISVSPDILDKDCTKISGVKLDALHDIVDGLGDQKAVIFSQYARVIRNLGLPNCVTITGDTPDHLRATNIEQFQHNEKIRLFAATTQCGGQSITLTAGTVVIFLDLLWTPALNNQAVDRVHRRGQQAPSVTVINLVTNNTVEDYILEVLGNKQALFDELIPETKINRLGVDYLARNNEK